jgi:hypothetical protein
MKTQMLLASLTTMVVGAGCVGVRVAPALPSQVRADHGCSLDVLPLPPNVPFETLTQAGTLNMLGGSLAELARQGCAIGADAIVVPLPPDALHGSLWGTFIRRRAVIPAEHAGVPIPPGKASREPVAAGLAEQ